MAQGVADQYGWEGILERSFAGADVVHVEDLCCHSVPEFALMLPHLHNSS